MLFWSSSIFHNSDPLESAQNTPCLSEPGSTCVRGSIGESCDELKVCALLCSRSPRRFSEVLSSTKFSLHSCSQLSNACDISLCTSSDSIFSVSVEWCNRSPRSSSFIPPFLSDTGASTSLFPFTESLLADVDSCDEDDGEVGEGVV